MIVATACSSLKFVGLVQQQQQADRVERILKEKFVRSFLSKGTNLLHSMIFRTLYLQHGVGIVFDSEEG